MTLPEWIRCKGDDRDQLLHDARLIARHLPPATDGSMIAVAFGQGRPAFAASLVACWLRGHGAAVVENASRERILNVLQHPSVVFLLHDTASGRALQVPRLLASPREAAAPAAPPGEMPTPMLAVHVQTEDGDLHWCSWTPSELITAIDAVEEMSTTRGDRPATPGLLSSLFADTLAWLRGHRPLDEGARRVYALPIPGAPEVATRYAALIKRLLAADGVDDVAVVHDHQGEALIAVAGTGAADLARTTPNAHALEEIPRDPNGQPVRAEVCLLCGLGRSGQPITRELTWRATKHGDDEAAWQTTLPTDYVFYEGHFAGYPVLAGGVQLHELVLPRLRALAGHLPKLEQLDGIKFLARFTPGDTIEVTFRRQADARKVTFEVCRGETRCTTGRLQFAAEVAPLTANRGAPE